MLKSKKSLSSTIIGLLYIFILPIVASCQNTNPPHIRLIPELGIHFKETRTMVGISGECLIALKKSVRNYNLYYQSSGNKSIIGKNAYIRGYSCDHHSDNSYEFLTLIFLSADKELKRPLLDAQIITYLDSDYNIIKWGH